MAGVVEIWDRPVRRAPVWAQTDRSAAPALG